MAEEQVERVVVRDRVPPSTTIPNAIFAICMVLFIVFIFWQFGMPDDGSSVGVSQNSRGTVPLTTPSPTPN